MRRVARVLVWLLLPLGLTARQRVQGDCAQGNHTVTTAGVVSTTRVMQSFPVCRVEVFLTGTVTDATLFSDNNGTPLGNPFNSDATGHWFWYADDGTYDVNLSAGGIPTPFTLGGEPAIDPFFTATGAGAVPRTKQAKEGDIVSVFDYGAVCDGVTDDTTRLNNAITAAAAAGKALVTPSGTCIHQPITISSAVTIILQAGSSWKLKAGTTGADQITVSANNVSFFGPGTLDGNNANNPLAKSGIQGGNAVTDLTIDGVTFLNDQTSNIRVEGARNHIRHNVFNGSTGYAAVYFDLAGGGVTDSEIVDNFFLKGIGQANGGNPQDQGNAVGIVGSGGNLVARNRISGYSRMCIEVQQSTGNKSQVIDNHCTVNSAIANGPAFGLSITTAPNSIVSGNFIEFIGSVNAYGIENVLSDYMIISNNTIINAFIPIGINRSNHCDVSLNTINGVNGTTQAGIVVTNAATALSVASNAFVGNNIKFAGAGRGIWQQCNNAAANCSNNEYNGNIIEGDQTASSVGILCENDLGTSNHNSVVLNNIKNVAIGLTNGVGCNNTLEIDGTWDTVPTLVLNTGTIVTSALVSSFTPTTTGFYRVVSSTSDATVSGTLDVFGQYVNTISGAITKVSRLTVEARIAPFGGSSLITVSNLGVYTSNFGVIDQIEASSDGAGHAFIDFHIAAPSGAETAKTMTVIYSGQSISASQVVAVPVVGATPGGSSISLFDFGPLNAGAPPAFATTGPIISKSYNYVGSETGAANAIVGTLGGVTLAEGQCVLVKLAHSLQAGANTFALNGGGAVAIKSHLNPANNIAAAYTAAGFWTGCYDATGPAWLDMSQ